MKNRTSLYIKVYYLGYDFYKAFILKFQNRGAR